MKDRRKNNRPSGLGVRSRKRIYQQIGKDIDERVELIKQRMLDQARRAA